MDNLQYIQGYNPLSRDPVSLRLPQILGGMYGFDRPEELFGLVDREFFINFHPMLFDEEWKDYVTKIPDKYIRFFGYKYQCLANLENYPGTVLIENIKEKLENYYK